MRFPVALVLAVGLAGAGAYASAPTRGTTLPEPAAFAGGSSLNNKVLKLALSAAACARSVGAATNDRLLTVIDYSRASSQPRLWVLDLVREQVLFEELVAHGRGSGENFATRFSNDDGSHQTSLGLFRTGRHLRRHQWIFAAPRWARARRQRSRARARHRDARRPVCQ